MKFIILFVATLCLSSVYGTTRYLLGTLGHSCLHACANNGLYCSSYIGLLGTSGVLDMFRGLGVNCVDDYSDNSRNWWGSDQPCFVHAPGDRNDKKCIGFDNMPIVSSCSAAHPNVQRLCRCESDALSAITIEDLNSYVVPKIKTYIDSVNGLKDSVQTYKTITQDLGNTAQRYIKENDELTKRAQDLTSTIAQLNTTVQNLTSTLEYLKTHPNVTKIPGFGLISEFSALFH